jgi:hypothetical protein
MSLPKPLPAPVIAAERDFGSFFMYGFRLKVSFGMPGRAGNIASSIECPRRSGERIHYALFSGRAVSVMLAAFFPVDSLAWISTESWRRYHLS